MSKATYERRKNKGMCTKCGIELALKDKTMCNQCLIELNTYYYKRRNNNLCTRCGKDNIVEDKSMCLYCMNKEAKRIAKRKEENILNGVCVDCGKSPLASKRLCQICLDKKKKYRKNNTPKSD